MNIWRRVQRNQSVEIPVPVPAGLARRWLGTVPNYLYSSFLLFYFFIAARCFSPHRSWMQWQPSLPWLLYRSFMKLIFFQIPRRSWWPALLTWIFPAGSISEAEGVRTPDTRKFCLWKKYCIYSTTYLPAFENLILVWMRMSTVLGYCKTAGVLTFLDGH